jgi:hypothetical protein
MAEKMMMSVFCCGFALDVAVAADQIDAARGDTVSVIGQYRLL